MTPMVALGGSAGAISALVEFFRAMPPDSGLIFVVALHLSPTHDSTLAELLGRETKMPVVQAENCLEVAANHVYVIPPGKYLSTVGNYLRLTDIVPEQGKRVAIDLLFRSIADNYGPHSIAIVLSGADGDGTLGIKRIKERGGLTIVQDIEEAEYPSMPKSSIETGMVDWVLKIAEMPGRLLEYQRIGKQLGLPDTQGRVLLTPDASSNLKNETALRDIIAFLHMKTGRDFACYKKATIVRRIARRMQVNSVTELGEYFNFLRTHAGESGALLQDFLISVTNFFRDRDVFEKLETLIPELFAGKTSSDTVRVWVPACATGEEAYSIAMLLMEFARSKNDTPQLQIFACDLDDDAIRRARVGHYPDAMTADVSEERLRKFFIKEQGGYRVRRELREMVLFATHDLLKDPPFSRMDLISCRNLLIYLEPEAQRHAFEIFHFALKPGAMLLLGSSEAVDEGSLLFSVVDKKRRIYSQQPVSRGSVPLPSRQSYTFRHQPPEDVNSPLPVVHGSYFAQDSAVNFQSRRDVSCGRVTPTETHFKLLERFGPPSIVVDSEHEIMHLSAQAGLFLNFIGGEPTNNVLRVVNSDLRIELRSLLYRSAEGRIDVEAYGVPATIGGTSRLVDLHVQPAGDIAPGFFLITFESREQTPTEQAGIGEEVQSRANSDSVVRQVENELQRVKTHLRETVEQYEASVEELKASNEELQAMNEELRSATEELETSREELQSINEKLTTVNYELNGKVEELANTNSDLQNLMASTSIATIFLDRDLVIKRFTPSASPMFNLIPTDLGRPLSDLKHCLEYPELISDFEAVLQSLVPVDREIRAGNRWYFARILPYRTLEDHIAGTVLTFVEITDRTNAAEAQRVSEERMRILIESAQDYAIFTIDKNRLVESWNKGAEAVFGYSEHEIVGQSADVLFTPQDRLKGDAAREVEVAVTEGRAQNERWHVRKDGSFFYGSGSVTPLCSPAGDLGGFVKILRDLTESKQAQEALETHVTELTRFNEAAVGRESRMIELKEEVNVLLSRLGEEARYEVEANLDGQSGEGL